MPFDWREFLVIAHELRIDRREAAQRTCVGRAYYYVYNLGLEMAQQMGRQKPRSSGSLHKALWNWCQGHSDENIKQLGILGSRMHSLRIEADYFARALSGAQDVEKQLSRARDFEVRVAQQNGQPPPTALL